MMAFAIFLQYLKGEKLGYGGWSFLYEIIPGVGSFSVGYAMIFYVAKKRRDEKLSSRGKQDNIPL